MSPRRLRPPPAATERPLEEGAQSGLEPWRTLDGVEFCHWDRWLLRLALTESDGLASIAREFHARARNRNHSDRDGARAMLAQIDDLQRRLAQIGRTPATILDESERASEWLRKKAFRRVWHGDVRDRTAVMLDTPERRLEERALRGHWPEFPISPAPFAWALQSATVSHEYPEWWQTGAIATGLELEIERLALTTPAPLARIALYRAALTALIVTMEHVDDSGADIAEVYAVTERAYLELLRDALEHSVLLRDLLDLAIWEPFGLTQGVEEFLRALPEVHADRALHELARRITELRRDELEYPLKKARELRRAVLASVQNDNGSDVDAGTEGDEHDTEG